MICKHCGEPIHLYDLAYLNPSGPRYCHGEKYGWFSCIPFSATTTIAEPEVSPYLFGEAGHNFDLAWRGFYIPIRDAVFRTMEKILR